LLLILDLDDTLINTSGALRARKLADAFDAMVEGGLPASAELARLMEIDSSSVDVRETLQQLVQEAGGSTALVELGLGGYYGPLPDDLAVPLLEGAHEALADLSRTFQLAIVTVGAPAQQWEKLQRCGLDLDLFDRIEVLRDGPKGEVYRQILDEMGIEPHDVVVCGDKADVDLRPAKELGCKTVQMVWGRAGRRAGGEQWVDRRVSTLSELANISLNP